MLITLPNNSTSVNSEAISNQMDSGADASLHIPTACQNERFILRITMNEGVFLLRLILLRGPYTVIGLMKETLQRSRDVEHGMRHLFSDGGNSPDWTRGVPYTTPDKVTLGESSIRGAILCVSTSEAGKGWLIDPSGRIQKGRDARRQVGRGESSPRLRVNNIPVRARGDITEQFGCPSVKERHSLLSSGESNPGWRGRGGEEEGRGENKIPAWDRGGSAASGPEERRGRIGRAGLGRT
ncbi:hypothetical protein DFH09DRAFT_1078627 [Mycena vulgaris]|nr:hypothetical protein DFH09DRAFT_1078627 [Mycena vulgaris]